MRMFNAKDNRLTMLNLYSLPQRQSIMEERLWGVHGGITELFILSFKLQSDPQCNSWNVCMKI